MERDSRGRCVHSDYTMSTTYHWVKDKGYKLTVSHRYGIDEKRYEVEVEWKDVATDRNKRYYSCWDNIAFETEAEAWDWLNEIVDGKKDIDKILDDHLKRENVEAEARKAAKSTESMNHVLSLKTMLDAHNMSLDDFLSMMNEYRKADYDELKSVFDLKD